MLRIKFLLRQPNQPGVKAVYATVRYKNVTVILYPGISIHTSAWVRKNGINKPKEIPENYDLIDFLNDFAKLIREVHKDLQAKSPNTIVSPDTLKKAVYAKHLGEQVEKATAPKKETRVFIADFFQAFIDDSKEKKRLGKNGKAITEGTIASYKTCMKHYVQFEKNCQRKYTVSDLDQKLIDNFSNYFMQDHKMASNGSGKYMRTFRAVINYAHQKKLIKSEDMLDIKIRVTHESPDNPYLTEKDINDLWAIKEFDTKLYEVVRDLFILGCHTGLRFSDYGMLRTARIESGFMFVNQRKTNRLTTIPIHDRVQEIISKYPNGLPSAPPNQVFNRYIKELCKKLPQMNTDFEKVVTRSGVPERTIYKKFELIQSHTARRSFATNAYLSGVPAITIMAITGHKTEKSFMLYIKANGMEHAMLLAKQWKLNKKEDEEAHAIAV